MQTIEVDILNDKAINLLRDLESLKLIKLRLMDEEKASSNWEKYKGSMTQQSKQEVDKQLSNLRDAWE